MNTTDLTFINAYLPQNAPRVELNGVLFDVENNMVVATDTRALIAFRHEMGEDVETTILRKEVVKLAVKATKKTKPLNVCYMTRKETREWLDGETMSELLIGDYHLISAPTIRGHYPQWERIVPPIKEYTKRYIINGYGEKIDENGREKEEMTVIEARLEFVEFEIAKYGMIIDKKLIKPLNDWAGLLRTNDEEFEKAKIYFTGTDKPVRIEHKLFSLVIMPIVMYED